MVKDLQRKRGKVLNAIMIYIRNVISMDMNHQTVSSRRLGSVLETELYKSVWVFEYIRVE